VDFENRCRLQPGRETDRLAAEVVVPLDDRVGADAAGECGDRAGSQEPEMRRAERRLHRDPTDARGAPWSRARRDQRRAPLRPRPPAPAGTSTNPPVVPATA